MVGNVTPGAYSVETLMNGDNPFDRSWRQVAVLPTPEWGGSPLVVLSTWLTDENPDPGTYRCTDQYGKHVVIPWTGDDE
jgi:hypothetical protein